MLLLAIALAAPQQDRLTLYEPVDYTRLTGATQDWAIGWMKR